MADAFVRIGDPERSAATELLEGHLRAGRITPEDFKGRVQRIARCRTVRDLDQVMVGFQHLAPQSGLSELGAIPSSPTSPGVEQAPSEQVFGPGWYEVIDPWDTPLGQSPLTLRKARRIGWVFALAMSTFTAAPLSLLFPSALEALIVFAPIAVMIVLSFWIAPNEKKTYRWVATPTQSADRAGTPSTHAVHGPTGLLPPKLGPGHIEPGPLEPGPMVNPSDHYQLHGAEAPGPVGGVGDASYFGVLPPNPSDNPALSGAPESVPAPNMVQPPAPSWTDQYEPFPIPDHSKDITSGDGDTEL